MTDVRSDDARTAAWVTLVLEHRLTLVVAAPGWGKTALLRAIAAAAPSIEVSRPPAGWTPLSLARQLVDELTAAAPRRRRAAGTPAPDSPDNPAQVGVLAATVCATAPRAVDA